MAEEAARAAVMEAVRHRSMQEANDRRDHLAAQREARAAAGSSSDHADAAARPQGVRHLPPPN